MLSSFCLSLTLLLAAPEQGKYFEIQVLDEQTGRGVPLVELKTVNEITYYTDNTGRLAFYEPGLMGQKVYFHIQSHGYEMPADGFGFRGKALDIQAGGQAVIKLKRSNIAERLYRVTGAGQYRDTLLLGHPTPLKHPALNGLVMGSDSVVNTLYQGKLYWFWGDTNRPAYPLGNYQTPGAISELPKNGGLDPASGVNLQYFVDENGFAKPACAMPGSGPTWINGLTVLNDDQGRSRMFAGFAKIKPPLSVYQRGIAQWDDEKQAFQPWVTFDHDSPAYPQGHPFFYPHGTQNYVYFANPYPFIRVKADIQNFGDVGQYESFTCLKENEGKEGKELDRDEEGKLQWGWKKNTRSWTPELQKLIQKQLRKDDKQAGEETWLALQDVETGKQVTAHGGSVYWNEYRKRWVLIVVETFGTSVLGEVWYAEADTPLGPWAYARKIITHNQYTFYNPKQHPMFDEQEGRIIYLEGTYTAEFSGNPVRTPRYNYNQMMYRLDLADARLTLPVPVYRYSEHHNRFAVGLSALPVASQPAVSFFALDRQAEGTVAVYESLTVNGAIEWNLGKVNEQETGRKPLFYALPVQNDATKRPKNMVALYEYVRIEGAGMAYATEEVKQVEEFKRREKPMCWVWKNPVPAVPWGEVIYALGGPR